MFVIMVEFVSEQDMDFIATVPNIILDNIVNVRYFNSKCYLHSLGPDSTTAKFFERSFACEILLAAHGHLVFFGTLSAFRIDLFSLAKRIFSRKSYLSLMRIRLVVIYLYDEALWLVDYDNRRQ